VAAESNVTGSLLLYFKKKGRRRVAPAAFKMVIFSSDQTIHTTGGQIKNIKKKKKPVMWKVSLFII
jgi:hypothetical protein